MGVLLYWCELCANLGLCTGLQRGKVMSDRCDSLTLWEPEGLSGELFIDAPL